MFQLTTSRLRLIPLTYEQLVLLTKNRNILEKNMGLAFSQFELNAPDDFLAELNDALLNFSIPKVQIHEDHFEWFTHWLIVHADLRLTIGGIGLSGLPDDSGQVMTGYYIDKKYEGMGFATEAVERFVQWIFENPAAQKVVADTLLDGWGSQKVLLKNGFELTDKVDGVLRWERMRNDELQISNYE